MRLGEGMPCSGASPHPHWELISRCLVTSHWPEHWGRSPDVNTSHILRLQRAAPVEGAPGCSLAGTFGLLPVGISGHVVVVVVGVVRGSGKGMSTPLFELTQRLAQRSQEAASKGLPWRVVENWQREGHTTQMAPAPPLPPQSLPRGLLGPMEPGIPFSLALITIRCRKWKITALAHLG